MLFFFFFYGREAKVLPVPSLGDNKNMSLILAKRNARISEQTGETQMFNSQKSTLSVKLNKYLYVYM